MNLDTLCAHYGYKIVQEIAGIEPTSKEDKNKLENTITKALGVLQEDGVYAMFLFLDYFKDRGESHGADKIFEQVVKLLRESEVHLLREQDPTQNERNDFPALAELGNNLDRLLLSRQLLEQTLIYARYHAKALPVTSGGHE